MKTDQSASNWQVSRVLTAVRTIEGDGFPVRRAVPLPPVEAVGPFIFLDHIGPIVFGPGEALGASVHPHAGIETLTLLMEGNARHKDSLGNESTMATGEVQWLRAGRGVVHDEQPAPALKDQGGLFHGVQLWLNMPAAHKQDAPEYRHFLAADVPQIAQPGVRVRIVASSVGELHGPVKTTGGATVLHMTCETGSTAHLPGLQGPQLAIYVMTGEVRVGSNQDLVKEGSIALLQGGPDLAILSCLPSECLVFGGEPLDEPIVRYGPFVMNDPAGIQRAIRSFQEGRMGHIN